MYRLEEEDGLYMYALVWSGYGVWGLGKYVIVRIWSGKYLRSWIHRSM